MPPQPYRPRDPTASVITQLLSTHLDTFIDRAEEGPGAHGVPRFVQGQLRAMIGCGDPTHGFVRLACTQCRVPRAVPFSCKARLCSSCAGRRMTEQAAHLVDRVLPVAPYRQWVLTLPSDLARAVAFDADLCSAVFACLPAELRAWARARAESRGVTSSDTGCVLEIQRFADAGRLYPHAHVLSPDGVFVPAEDRARFHGLGPPTLDDVRAIVHATEARIGRVLDRRRRSGRVPEGSEQLDLLLACARAPAESVTDEPAQRPSKRAQPGNKKGKPLCARSPGGLELHAAVHVRADDRSGLERLCRYIARPPVPQQRLSLLPDGRYEWRLKRTWKGGVRALVYEPLDLIARLAALIPLPMTKMRRFFGVFGPAHPWRAAVVPPAPDPATSSRPVAPKRPARMAWSDLLKRVFNIDGLRCLKCSGRMLVVGVVKDPDVIEAILAAISMSEAIRDGAATSPRGPPACVA